MNAVQVDHFTQHYAIQQIAKDKSLDLFVYKRKISARHFGHVLK